MSINYKLYVHTTSYTFTHRNVFRPDIHNIQIPSEPKVHRNFRGVSGSDFIRYRCTCLGIISMYKEWVTGIIGIKTNGHNSWYFRRTTILFIFSGRYKIPFQVLRILSSIGLWCSSCSYKLVQKVWVNSLKQIIVNWCSFCSYCISYVSHSATRD